MSDTSQPVALITGATRGIGRRTALILAEKGWRIAFTGRTEHEGDGNVLARDNSTTVQVPGSFATTQAELEGRGAPTLALSMDLLDAGSVRSAAAAVLGQWGRVDLLVNNAIAHLPGNHAPLLELDADDVTRVLVANFVHQVELAKALLPAMLATGRGVIVNLASGSATTDSPGPPGAGGWGLGYAASKAACGRLAGAINAEFGTRGIRAFNVDPGFVITEAQEARGGSAAIADAGFAADLSDPGAAGKVIAWLAVSPEADTWLGRVIWSPKLAPTLPL